MPEDNKAHLVEPEYGSPYWRKFATCSDGSVVSGHGSTAEDAEEDAAHEVFLREEFLALPDIWKLKILVAGNLMDTDQRAAIRIMAKLLIEHHELQKTLHPDQQ
jgi:hypothetical protein